MYGWQNMSTTNQPIHYGYFTGICQVCFNDETRFGTLVDPNGHTWLVCRNCINQLWEKAQALNQVAPDKIQLAIEALREALREDSSG